MKNEQNEGPGENKKSGFQAESEPQKDGAAPMQIDRNRTKLPPGQTSSTGKDNSGFTPFEELMIEWSVAMVGRNWTIVEDTLRIYPLTSGQLRE